MPQALPQADLAEPAGVGMQPSCEDGSASGGPQASSAGGPLGSQLMQATRVIFFPILIGCTIPDAHSTRLLELFAVWIVIFESVKISRSHITRKA